MLAVITVVGVPIILRFVGLGAIVEWLIVIVRWPLIAGLLALALAVLYRFGPSRDQPQWRWVTWGSAVAALLWVVVSGLFSWYVANFGSYNETYGSLGAIVGFMTWIWLSTTVVLLGAELNAEIEHQTEKDTTIGRSQPTRQRVEQRWQIRSDLRNEDLRLKPTIAWLIEPTSR